MGGWLALKPLPWPSPRRGWQTSVLRQDRAPPPSASARPSSRVCSPRAPPAPAPAPAPAHTFASDTNSPYNAEPKFEREEGDAGRLNSRLLRGRVRAGGGSKLPGSDLRGGDCCECMSGPALTPGGALTRAQAPPGVWVRSFPHTDVFEI